MLLDLRDELVAWRKTGTRFALATVVRTWKSAPRPAGAVMAVAENGKVIGSVSGGCVEAWIDQTRRVKGAPRRRHPFVRCRLDGISAARQHS
jgi:xanthine/CO dehydrogenase XdhC/CoxF family maturation factor